MIILKDLFIHNNYIMPSTQSSNQSSIESIQSSIESSIESSVQSSTGSTKQCRKCNITKNVTEFSKHTGTADKLDNRCKACVKLVKQKMKEKANEQPDDQPIELLDKFETDLNNDGWQGGKLVGNVFKRTTQNIEYYVASVNGHQKSFNIAKLGKENA